MKSNKYLDFVTCEMDTIISDLLIESKEDISIYSGSSGILIFLIEYYSITFNSNILSKIDKQIEANLNIFKGNKKTSYSFYTGNMGLSHCLVKLYKITGNGVYLEQAISIAKYNRLHFTVQKSPLVEILNGVSGVLLGLMEILSCNVNEKWLWDDIIFYIDYIVLKADLDISGGIFWDKSYRNIKGLTGFSHGASGVGFVFYQLFLLSNQSGFREVAHLAFKYEDYYYDNQSVNWLDFRNFPYTEISRKQFISHAKCEDVDFFKRKKIMTAWCHGSPGIILARSVTDYNNCNNMDEEVYMDTIIASFKTSNNHSLCHSGIGNALCSMSILESSGKNITKEIDSLASYLVKYYGENGRFLNGHNDNQNYNSLFMGNLGPLYFLLKAHTYMLTGKITNNILSPNIQSDEKYNTKSDWSYSQFEIYNKLLANKYPYTYKKLNELNISLKIENTEFEKEFTNKILSLNVSEIKYIFQYENELRLIEKINLPYNYNYFRTLVDHEKIESLRANEFLALNIKLNSGIKLIKVPKSVQSSENTQSRLVALIPNIPFRFQFTLEIFTTLLIDTLKEVEFIRVDNFMKLIQLNISQKEDKAKVEKLIIKNIKTLLGKGLIRIIH